MDHNSPASSLYRLPPDQDLRTFRVVLPFGETEDVQGHATDTKQGVLRVLQHIGDSGWTVRLFPPGQWLRVVSEPPTRESIERYREAMHQYQLEQQVLVQSIAAAETRENRPAVRTVAGRH